MNHVIIVNGPPRAGKDTAIEFMTRAFKQRGYTVREFSSIDPVRNQMQFFGIDVTQKTPADRKLLATIGDALQEHSDYRTNQCIAEAKKFFDWVKSHRDPIMKGVMFIHIREPDLIKKLELDMTVPVTTVYVKGGLSESVEHNNPADANTEKMNYDIYIFNNGSLGGLFDQCESVVEVIEGTR